MMTTPDPSPAPLSFPSPLQFLSKPVFSVIYASPTATLPRPSRSIFSECVSSLRCQAQPKQTTHDVFSLPQHPLLFFILPSHPFSRCINAARRFDTAVQTHQGNSCSINPRTLIPPLGCIRHHEKRRRSGVVPTRLHILSQRQILVL